MLPTYLAAPVEFAMAALAAVSSVGWMLWVTIGRLIDRPPRLALSQFLVMVAMMALLLAIPTPAHHPALRLIALAGVIQVALGCALAASYSTRPSAADALIGAFAGLLVLLTFTVWWGLVLLWLG